MRRSLLIVLLLAVPFTAVRAEIEDSGELMRWVGHYRGLQRDVAPAWPRRTAWTEAQEGHVLAYGVGSVTLPRRYDATTSATSLEVMITVADNRAATAVATLLAAEAGRPEDLPPSATQRLASIVRASATVTERFVADDGRTVHALARLAYDNETLVSLLAVVTGDRLPEPSTPPSGGAPLQPDADNEEAPDPDEEIFIPGPTDGTITLPGPDPSEVTLANPTGGELTVSDPNSNTITIPAPGSGAEIITIPAPGTAAPEPVFTVPTPAVASATPAPAPSTARPPADDSEWHIPAPNVGTRVRPARAAAAVTAWRPSASDFGARVRKLGVLTPAAVRLSDGLAPRIWIERDHWTSLGPGFRVVFAVGEARISDPTNRATVEAAFVVAQNAAIQELPADLRAPRDPLDFHVDGSNVISVLVGALVVE